MNAPLLFNRALKLERMRDGERKMGLLLGRRRTRSRETCWEHFCKSGRMGYFQGMHDSRDKVVKGHEIGVHRDGTGIRNDK